MKTMSIGLLIALLMANVASNAYDRHRPRKVKVHFLADSTLVRGSWGFNQDIYLAELIEKKDSGRRLVRIVDEYSPDAPPLSHEVLVDEQGTGLRVRRDESCDLAYGAMHMRAAPGDSMAILPIKMQYQPQFRQAPEQSELLPCFRIARY
ncbi:MAG: hypothetical protein P4K83_11675 [Terracidiphilus sp.]|nr:hypothetical protein [Terracidiphilus sp.]